MDRPSVPWESEMPSTLRRMGWALGAMAALAWASTAGAAGLAAADARQVRDVVEAQLAAFAEDDAERAYSYAAPNVRRLFPTPGLFMAMVRSGYPVVYRPATVAFLPAEREDEGDSLAVLTVQMTDGDGALWRVVYHLQRQAGTVWQITGCEAEREAGFAT